MATERARPHWIRVAALLRASRRAAPLRTLRLALRTHSSTVVVFPDVSVSVGRGASIGGDGRLQLGCRWQGLRYLPSELSLARGARLVVHGQFRVHTGLHISVAEDATLTLGGGYTNNGVTIDCFDAISIGRGVAISKGVTLRDSDNHHLGHGGPVHAPIVIEDRVWIGLNATVLKGVRIGAGAVVAAGAVVTRDVPAGCLAAGVPARVIREGVTWR